MRRGYRSFSVMAGLVPAIHAFLDECGKDVDARDKRGHDKQIGCQRGYRLNRSDSQLVGPSNNGGGIGRCICRGGGRCA